jgi:hypothetical protein
MDPLASELSESAGEGEAKQARAELSLGSARSGRRDQAKLNREAMPSSDIPHITIRFSTRPRPYSIKHFTIHTFISLASDSKNLSQSYQVVSTPRAPLR